MNRWHRVLIYGFVLLCSSIGFVVVLEEDTWVKRQLELYMNETFSHELQCQFTAQVSQIQLFQGFIALEHVGAIPCDQSEQWQWHAQSARIAFSWLDLLLRGRFVLSIQAENVDVHSYVDVSHTISIMSHIMSLDQESVYQAPVAIQSFQLFDSYISLYQSSADMIYMAAHIDAQSVHDVFKVSIRPYNGTALYSGRNIASDASGLITVAVDSDTGALQRVLCDMHVQVLSDEITENNDLAITGNWKDGTGTLYVDNVDSSLAGWASFDTCQCTGGDLYIPVAYPMAFFASNIQVSGMSHVQWSRNEQDNLSVNAGLDGGVYQAVQLPQVYIQCNKDNDIWNSTVLIGTANETYVSGFGTYNSEGCISGSVVEVRPITIGSTTISSGYVYGAVDIENGSASVRIEGGVMRPGNTYYIEDPVHTEVSLEDEAIECIGSYGQYSYMANILHENKQLYMHNFYLQHGDDVLVAMTGTPEGSCDVKIDISLIQRIFQYTTGLSIKGNGDIYVSGRIDNNRFIGDMHTQQLRIHLPMTYQLIEGLSGTFTIDPFEQSFIASDVRCDLYKGILSASYIGCKYDLRGIHSFFAPVQMSDVFLHWKRDVFLQASGVLVLSYMQQEPIDLSGVIHIDQSYARGNPFSPELQRLFLTSSLSSYDMDLPDMHLHLHTMTGMPLEIDTPFLQASAHIDGSVSGYMSQPGIEGVVTFLHGSLLFPYQPLYITKGSLTVIPHQPDDMFIELVARNTIKQYDISLYVDGPLSEPRISFESLPILDKEQIVTLLMGGSEDGSLYFMMPKLVADSVEDLIFGSADTVLGIKNYIQRIFRPFRNIRFIPGFSDQSARGGVRGSLSIEVNERLRAFIQKNFSLSEDAAFEVSYLMSDDTSIRILKDERGDLGGEIETRWRF